MARLSPEPWTLAPSPQIGEHGQRDGVLDAGHFRRNYVRSVTVIKREELSVTTSEAPEENRTFSLGMANGDIPDDPKDFTPELVRSWRARGLSCVAVAFARPPAELNAELMREVRARLSGEGIHVSEFAGINANLVHPDQDVRNDAVARVKAAVGPASALGATCINSGPGSCSPNWRQSFYRPDRCNYTQEAEDRAVETLVRIGEVIDDTELMYTVECHLLTTMRSATVIRRVLDRVDHPRVLANFDPINLLDSAYAAFTNADRIPEMVETVGPRFAHTCHIKDVVVTDALPLASHEAPPGTGLVRIDTILEAAKNLPGEGSVDLIVEHLDPLNATASLELVRRRAVEAGITLN